MISFGTVFLELVLGHLPELPRPGEEVFTDDFAVSCGGAAVTSASTAARAGIHAGLCTVLGNDLGSRVVLTHCGRTGVDVSPSVRVPRRSAGVSVVLNFDGDRAFVTHIPPRPAGEQPEVDRWRDVLLRERPRWCYLHAGRGVPGFLHAARSVGAKVMLDTSLSDMRERDLVIECVGLADVFVPNEAELRRLTGAESLESAVSAAAAWGTPLVVKRGAAGALVVDGGTVAEVRDGVRAVRVRDLTGAGDSFAGALTAELPRSSPCQRGGRGESGRLGSGGPARRRRRGRDGARQCPGRRAQRAADGCVDFNQRSRPGSREPPAGEGKLVVEPDS
jgi:sugar/nucleoside kinase (ribokinase family)